MEKDGESVLCSCACVEKKDEMKTLLWRGQFVKGIDDNIYHVVQFVKVEKEEKAQIRLMIM